MESTKNLKEINTGRITALDITEQNSIKSVYDIYQLISFKLSIPVNEIQLMIKDKFIKAKNYTIDDGEVVDVMTAATDVCYFAHHHENKLTMVEFQQEKFDEKERIVTQMFPYTVG